MCCCVGYRLWRGHWLLWSVTFWMWCPMPRILKELTGWRFSSLRCTVHPASCDRGKLWISGVRRCSFWSRECVLLLSSISVLRGQWTEHVSKQGNWKHWHAEIVYKCIFHTRKFIGTPGPPVPSHQTDLQKCQPTCCDHSNLPDKIYNTLGSVPTARLQNRTKTKTFWCGRKYSDRKLYFSCCRCHHRSRQTASIWSHPGATTLFSFHVEKHNTATFCLFYEGFYLLFCVFRDKYIFVHFLFTCTS